MLAYKPSDEVLAYLVTLGPVTLAEFTHVTVKVYCVSGLNSVTVSLELELPISAVNTVPPANMYVTMYLPEPTPEHPLNASTTDLEVIFLSSMDTLGMGGTVWRHYNASIHSSYYQCRHNDCCIVHTTYIPEGSVYTDSKEL